MLASILPGFREVRAPIAAGTLWVVIFWLILGDAIRDQLEPGGAVSRIYEMRPILQGAGIAVVASIASVAAYLVGSLAMAFSNFAWAWLKHAVISTRNGIFQHRSARASGIPSPARARRDLQERLAMHGRGRFTKAGVRELNDYVLQRSRKRHPTGSSSTPEQVKLYARLLAAEISLNFDLIKMRALSEAPDLHAEIDRRDNEAEFRFALALPLVTLTFYLIISESPLWVFATPLIVGLYLQGQQLRRSAADAMIIAAKANPSILPQHMIDYVDELTAEIPRPPAGVSTNSVAAPSSREGNLHR